MSKLKIPTFLSWCPNTRKYHCATRGNGQAYVGTKTAKKIITLTWSISEPFMFKIIYSFLARFKFENAWVFNLMT